MRAGIPTRATALLTLAAFLCLTLPVLGSHIDSLIFLHYWTGAMSGGVNEMVAAYNRTTPPIRVKATEFEHESFKVGIKVVLAGESPPDMFSYWTGARTQALVDKGYVASIDDVWRSANLDSVFPETVSALCTYNGHKYALPLTQHYVAFFYNKKIFDQLGMTPPATWKDFLTLCNVLKQADITPIALGSREGWPAQFWFDYLLLRTAGPDYRRRLMSGHASYTDPEVTSVFATWKTLLDSGYFSPNPNLLDWAESAQQVYSGDAAMTLMGTWVIGMFEGKLGWRQGQDYDFFRFPVMDPQTPMAAVGPIDAVLLPKGNHLTESKKCLTFLSNPGPQMEMSKGSGSLAPSLAVPDSFYPPMGQRILDIVRTTPHWEPPYDLATRHAVAVEGLEMFKNFIFNTGNCNKLLIDMAQKIRTHTQATTD